MLRATVDQQQDLVRYTRDLNHWFDQDRIERRRDVRAILGSLKDLRRNVPPVNVPASVPAPSTTVRTGTTQRPVIPSPPISHTGHRSAPRAQTPGPNRSGQRPPVIPSSSSESGADLRRA
ncbi:hypothetical protein PENSPDRAFT_439900 [Peniophora sp. CONT]|nr:hypothetical protein PENSPDRAFT_439900 [Peniophora sp. CONT]